MTIKTIYKVEGDSNEYDSEQEAQVAEALHEDDSFYLSARDVLKVAKAITKRYFLCPIPPTVTVQEPVGGQKDPLFSFKDPRNTALDAPL